MVMERPVDETAIRCGDCCVPVTLLSREGRLTDKRVVHELYGAGTKPSPSNGSTRSSRTRLIRSVRTRSVPGSDREVQAYLDH